MEERRKSKRRPVLESFSLFIVIPKKGAHRLKVYDISEGGLRFDYDLEGEPAELFPLKTGEQLEIQFYLNQRLYLPLSVKVARVENTDSVRRVGAEFTDPSSKTHVAFKAFLKMLDAVLDEAQLA